MKQFRDLYEEQYEEYSVVTKDQLLEVFTEEEIITYLKNGSIVLELDESLLKKVKKGVKKFKVISKAARRKMALRLKKLVKSASFKKKVQKSKLRIANPAKQRVKAAKMAKQKVISKYYPGYKEMGIAQRVKTDQMIQTKYSGMIAGLSKKLLKVVARKEKEKVKKAREAMKQDA